MSLLFGPLLLAILFVATLRRATAILVAGVVGWTLWQATHDLITTCVGGGVAVMCAAAMFDHLASSKHPGVRRISVLLETSMTATSAGLIAALMLTPHLDGQDLIFGVSIAALIGAGNVLDWRNRATPNRHA